MSDSASHAATEAEKPARLGIAPDQAPRIVYVASVTHSGSTLVDLVLGAHSQLESLGELKVLSRARNDKRERVLAGRCTCGADSKETCTFWRGVDARLRQEVGCGLHDVDLDAPDEPTFRSHNRALFAAASAVSGAAWIVDSSKSPRRLRRLLATGFDVRPIHLTRSPYGVTYSHIKKGRSTTQGALRYTKTRLQLEWLLRGVPHATLRYESFVRQPEAEMGRIMAWLGLGFEPRQLDWTAGPHHNICGNRMRFATTPEIRLDEAWRNALSPLQKGAVAGLTWPARLLRS